MIPLSISIQKLHRIESQLQNYQMIFRLCVAGAAIFTVFTVFLFFYFHIPKVFMELTGLDRRRKIGHIQKRKGRAGRKRVAVQAAAYHAEVSEETAILPDHLQEDGEETVVLQLQEAFVLEKELKLADSEECL